MGHKLSTLAGKYKCTYGMTVMCKLILTGILRSQLYKSEDFGGRARYYVGLIGRPRLGELVLSNNKESIVERVTRIPFAIV